MHDTVLEYEWELNPVTIEMMYRLAKAEQRRQAWREEILQTLPHDTPVEYTIPTFTSLIISPTNT